MIEMGLTPGAWREMSREDREFLLAIRRLKRSSEALEMDEARPASARGPGGGTLARPAAAGMMEG